MNCIHAFISHGDTANTEGVGRLRSGLRQYIKLEENPVVRSGGHFRLIPDTSGLLPDHAQLPDRIGGPFRGLAEIGTVVKRLRQGVNSLRDGEGQDPVPVCESRDRRKWIGTEGFVPMSISISFE